MKIIVTETIIEAGMEELKASNSLADGFSNMMRGIFNRATSVTTETTYDETVEEEEDGSEE